MKAANDPAARRRRTIFGHAVVLILMAAAGVLLAVQGWRTGYVGDDLVPYLDAARAFIADGRVPAQGNLTHFLSLTPPGFTWVVLPGFWFFTDPRLVEIPGEALLHLGTLTGVYLLARACLGRPFALLAGVLYGAGALGVRFAAMYETRGLPFFYVWVACATAWWVGRRHPAYLALALFVWSLGMYVHMELAPAILMLPVAWVLWRPPWRSGALAAAVALSLVIWAPYLRLETARGFADIRSQLLRETLHPQAPPTLAGCELPATPTRADGVESAAPPVRPTPPPTLAVRAGARALVIADGLVANFSSTLSGAPIVLLMWAVLGLTVAWLHPAASRPAGQSGASRRWAMVGGVGCVLGALLLNTWTLTWLIGAPLGDSRGVAVSARLLLVLAGIALLTWHRVRPSLVSLAGTLTPVAGEPRVLTVALVVPWVVLLVLTESGRLYRIDGLWPLQAVALAAGTVTLGRLAGGSVGGVARWLIPAAVIVTVAWNPLTTARVRNWRSQGWAGAEAAEVRVADLLASHIAASGRREAVIGYVPLVLQPEPPAWFPNQRTGPSFGQLLDIALEYRHGIVNRSACWARVSAADEYRVHETAPSEPGAVWRYEMAAGGPLRPLADIGSYRVSRVGPAAGH